MQPEVEKHKSLIFLGLKPWEIRGELDLITDRMIAQKAVEDKLKALEAAKPAEVIDVTKGDTDTDLESLEVVEPPPQDFNPGGSRR
jgi:hypothetical protein